MKEKNGRLAWILLAVILFAAPAGRALGQEIAVALAAEPATLNPQSGRDESERFITDNLFETLLVRSPDGSLAPGLAEGLPEPVAADTWRIGLRSGVFFHNGEPFNADAAVFSIRRMMDPRFNSPFAGLIRPVKQVRKIDDTHIDVVTDGPDPLLFARLAWLKMVPPRLSQFPRFMDAPAGTGPYRIVEWRRGQDIVLEPNAGYWGEKPAIRKATFRFVSDPQARISGLTSGGIDLVPGLLPEFAARAPRVMTGPGRSQPFVLLNCLTGPTRDVRVRQALNLAVDRAAILQMLYGGHGGGAAPGQAGGPAVPGMGDAAEAYPYDPERAWSLLADAGAVSMSIELLSPAGQWPRDRDLAEVLASYWNAVGVATRLNILNPEAYAARIQDKSRIPDAVLTQVSFRLMDVSEGFDAIHGTDGSGPFFADMELDKLLNAARSEIDAGKRTALYQEAGKRVSDNAYGVYLVNPGVIYGASQRLTWQPRPDGSLMIREMRVAP